MKKHIIMLAFAGMLYLPQAMAQEPGAPPPPPPHEGRPNIEKKINEINEKLNKELKLNDEQKVKVADAYKEFFKAIEKERRKGGEEEQPGHHGPLPKEVMDGLAKERDEKIKAVLKEDQFAKYLEIEKTLRPKRHGGPGEEGRPMRKPTQAAPVQ